MIRLNTYKFPKIFRSNPKILQVNLGYKCNQACIHCHVDASPLRKEMMSDEVISLIPKAINMYGIKVLDLTGGAPEMHPKFKDLILKAKSQNVEIIDRCNLTILKENGYEDISNFLACNKVRVVASLPCYLEENVDSQRGKGVFKKSIEALILLNKLGYGENGTNLILDLVYNPTGATLPPSQQDLEESYRKHLYSNYEIRFNKLLVLANMPIKRFSEYLIHTNQFEEYLDLLKHNYNERNLPLVMCMDTLSVDWKGNVYDCDFNQQLGINNFLNPKTLKELVSKKYAIDGQEITVADHCFGCTAGCGSSCGGSLT